jgi:hypothetical protein
MQLTKYKTCKNKQTMSKNFIVDGAPCTCKYGTVPGLLKVISHQIMVVNHGNRKIATSMELGAPFYPPMFGVCKSTWPPRQCSPAITQWDDVYKGMRINLLSNPLLPDSKATCSAGCPRCIDIVNHGQFQLLGLPHLQGATAEHQSELDPTGSLNEEERINISVIQL